MRASQWNPEDLVGHLQLRFRIERATWLTVNAAGDRASDRHTAQCLRCVPKSAIARCWIARLSQIASAARMLCPSVTAKSEAITRMSRRWVSTKRQHLWTRADRYNTIELLATRVS